MVFPLLADHSVPFAFRSSCTLCLQVIVFLLPLAWVMVFSFLSDCGVCDLCFGAEGDGYTSDGHQRCCHVQPPGVYPLAALRSLEIPHLHAYASRVGETNAPVFDWHEKPLQFVMISVLVLCTCCRNLGMEFSGPLSKWWCFLVFNVHFSTKEQHNNWRGIEFRRKRVRRKNLEWSGGDRN